MNLTLIAAAISAALSGAAGFGLAWKLQTANITALELNHANERIAVQRQARAAIERSLSLVSVAQGKAADRNKRIAADRVRAADIGNGLRNTSSASVRAAAFDSAACAPALAAHSVVLDRCAAELVRVSGDADQLVSEVILLQEAWPGRIAP